MKSAKPSLNSRIVNSKFNICKNFRYYLIAPLVLILAGIIIVCCIGFNTGIDFTGGTVIEVVAGDSIATDVGFANAKTKINNVLNDYGITAKVFQKAEADDGLTISFRFQDKKGTTDAEMNEINQSIATDLYAAFDYDSTDPVEMNYVKNAQRIGPTSSSELLMNAFIALLVATVAILIYIAFRFELASGLSAIIALLHDVLIMCAFVLIFRIQINSTFIAALITIVGYSINNTIIVFDRVRENRKNNIDPTVTNEQLINTSVKQTMIRSINTTATTLVAIVLLAIIGVASVREFAIPIIFGLLAGTYSSILIAPTLWAKMYRAKNKKQKEAPRLEDGSLVKPVE